MHLGISPAALFSTYQTDPLSHLLAVKACAELENYDTLELLLPDDESIRKKEIEIIKAHGKRLNYNAPAQTQVEGPFDPASPDKNIRQNARDFIKRHVGYALEGDAGLFMMTGCADRGEKDRGEVMARFEDHFFTCAAYCKENGLAVVLEPLERDRFKKIVLGPTRECADFIIKMQKSGLTNAHLMIDTAHLPLMGETFADALSHTLKASMAHLHLGDAVLGDENSPYYGHTHPPVEIQGGVFDTEYLKEVLKSLFDAGYLDKSGAKKANVSFEMSPYPGVSPELSAQVAYEKLKFALNSII